MRSVIKNAYGKAGGKEAEAEMAKALSRGTSIANLSRTSQLVHPTGGSGEVLIRGGSGDSDYIWGMGGPAVDGQGNVRGSSPIRKQCSDVEGGSGTESVAGRTSSSLPAFSMHITQPSNALGAKTK